MRVVTRAESMASMVSGRPGAVRGGGGNCEREGRARSAVKSKSVARRMRFKRPPKRTSVVDAPKAPEGRKRLAQGVSPGIILRCISSAVGAADHFIHRAVCRPHGAHIGITVGPSAYALG